MSLLAPSVRFDQVSVPNMDPNLSFALSALGALTAVYFLLDGRIHRVELAHKLMKARG